MEPRTILIIDDDSNFREIIESCLNNHGYHTILASNGEEGIAQAKTHKPHAILLDLLMPEMSGEDVLLALQEHRKTQNIPVIMLTGESALQNISSTLKLGATDYIVKPFEELNLVSRITEAIG